MVSASPEPLSVIPAEWPAEPTAGASSERNGTGVRSITYRTPVPPFGISDTVGQSGIASNCPSTGSATATTIKSQLSLSLELLQETKSEGLS